MTVCRSRAHGHRHRTTDKRSHSRQPRGSEVADLRERLRFTRSASHSKPLPNRGVMAVGPALSGRADPEAFDRGRGMRAFIPEEKNEHTVQRSHLGIASDIPP